MTIDIFTTPRKVDLCYVGELTRGLDKIVGKNVYLISNVNLGDDSTCDYIVYGEFQKNKNSYNLFEQRKELYHLVKEGDVISYTETVSYSPISLLFSD